MSDVETADANLTYEIVTPPAHGDLDGDDLHAGPRLQRARQLRPTASPTAATRTTAARPGRAATGRRRRPPRRCRSPSTRSTTRPPPRAERRRSTRTARSAIDLAALATDVETADANLDLHDRHAACERHLSGSGGARTYTPAADFNGSDSFTYTVTDRGDPDNCGAPDRGATAPESDTGTVSITVSAVNDAPVNTLPAGPVLALQDTNTPINGISVADVDAGADDVEVTLSVMNGTLTVALVPAGVTDITGNGTGTVVLVGSLLQINTTFATPNGLVFNGARIDRHAVRYDQRPRPQRPAAALTDTDTLAINVNTPPVAADQTPSTNEDTPVTITLSASDADGDASTFAIVTGPTNGTLGPIGAVTCNADAECLHGERDLHARPELQRPRQLHVHRQRRQRHLGSRDGLDHGQPGQRRAAARRTSRPARSPTPRTTRPRSSPPRRRSPTSTRRTSTPAR